MPIYSVQSVLFGTTKTRFGYVQGPTPVFPQFLDRTVIFPARHVLFLMSSIKSNEEQNPDPHIFRRMKSLVLSRLNGVSKQLEHVSMGHEHVRAPHRFHVSRKIVPDGFEAESFLICPKLGSIQIIPPTTTTRQPDQATFYIVRFF